MESKPNKDTYNQVSLNNLIKQQNRKLHFLTRVICLLFIVLLAQQKVIAQSLGLNTTGAIPDSSAMLDIISTNKGLLIPRVSLTSTTDTITIADPATSLLVYNTNASITGGSGVGYYYYNGSLWVNFVSGSSSSNYVQNQVASDQAAGLRMTGNGLFNGGQLTIGTATPSSGYLLTMNTSSGIGKGLNLTLSGGSGTGINVSSSNSAYDGMLITNSSSSVSSSFYGFGSVLSNTNIVSGYSGYRTSAGLSYGIYGINGTSALYATNASTWAAFLRGRTVISSEVSPTSGLGTDLEIRNTTTGAGNPSTVSLRQGTSNTTNATVLANLNFGDNHQTGAQAQIQITRSAAGGAGDLPTDMVFSTTPDASSTLTERMRILNNGNVGMGIINPTARMDITNTTQLKGLNINMSGTTSFTADVSYGAYILNDRGGSDNGATRYGAYIEGKAYNSSSNYNYGVFGVGTKNGGYGYTTVGVYGRAQHSYNVYSSFTSDLIGVQSDVTFVADVNTVSGSGSGYGFYATATIPSNKTLATYYGLYLKTPTVNGTLTTKWGIYQQDANSKNFLAGNVGIGTATPVNPLDVTGKIQATGVVSGDYLEFQGYGTMLAQASSSNYLVNNFIGNGGLGLHSRNTNPMGFLIDGVEKARLSSTGNFGVGAVGDASARLHTTSTTEQLRVGYDVSNYYSTTVGSTGGVTFDAVGAGSAFTFSDAVNLPTASTGVTQALNDSTTKIATTAFVDRALSGVSGGSGWGLTGTSGTVDGTNFIGTTDNIPFSIKVNNQKAGRIDQTLKNAFWGYQTGNANSTGHDNIAIGHQALYSNTTGYENTANGVYALYSNTGGVSNTATGFKALYTNSTGLNNTANGWWALLNNTGDANTAVGVATLYFNTTGYYNSASGYEALFWNTTGYKNTASGYFGLFSTSTGYHNTGHGYGAGYTNTTGFNNTFLGHNADVSSAALNNATAIGANASVNATNKVRIGDANVTVIEGQVAFTSVSDGRFKKNINETDVKGLPFIMRLRPVAYNIDTRQFEEFLVKNKPDSIKVKHFKDRDFTASTAIRHNGFIAQEVEQAAQATNYNFTGIHKPESADDNYGLAYSEFVVPLVKAMQEQQKIIDDLKLEIDKLKTEVSKIPK